MTAAFRDANLLIISLSAHAHSIHAGLGVSPELLAPPSISLPTTAYVRADLPQAFSQRKISDYSFEPRPGLVPIRLFNSSPYPTEEFEEMVTDWKALDAFFRYLLFTRLKLPKPPLAQHILFSIPPNIPHSTRDKLTQLFFESLQAPALFLIESPLLQILACNSINGITVDIGCRSTLVGFTSDSVLINYCCQTYPVGEQDCDDYLISLLLSGDEDLPARLGWSPVDPPESLYHSLLGLVSSLKVDGHVQFKPDLKTLKPYTQHTNSEEDEAGITDVAQAIVSGKADKIIGRQISSSGSAGTHSRKSTTQGKKLQAELLKETDTIIVCAPSSLQAPPIGSGPTSPLLETPVVVVPTDFGPVQVPSISRPQGDIQISKIRHRHAEPLFAPSLLRHIPAVFARFGLESWGKRYECVFLSEDEALTEAIKRGLQKVIDGEQRRSMCEHVILTGAAGVMCRTEGLADSISAQLQTLCPTMTAPNSNQELFKHLEIPDYFSEFKGRPEWIGFLGGCIVAKLVFNDASSSKLWMSKPDYTKEGPYISRKIAGLNTVSA